MRYVLGGICLVQATANLRYVVELVDVVPMYVTVTAGLFTFGLVASTYYLWHKR